MTTQLTITEIVRADKARERIDAIESEIGSRFYGLENVTQKGLRQWSIAPRAPRVAIDAIQGGRAPGPDHIITRWCNIRRAWRSIDLTTVRRINYVDGGGTKREIEFI